MVRLFQRRDLLDAADQGVHVVGSAQVNGEEDALVVITGEDQVVGAVDEVAFFLGLMAIDDDFGFDFFGEGGGGGSAHVAAPDELIDGAGAAGVVGAGEGAVEDVEVEFFDLRIGGERVAAEDAVGGGDGQGEAQEKLLDGDFDFVGVVVEDLFDAGGEGFADGEAGFHDSFAVDLGEVVVGQEKMNLAGEIALQLGGLEEHVPASLRAGGVEAVAVNEFMEDEVAVGIFVEGGVADDFFVVAAVVVKVAGHPQLALGRQVDDVEMAEGGDFVLFGGDLEGFDDTLGGGGHRVLLLE